MSRVGKVPITIPGGVDVQIDGGQVRVKGAKGEATVALHALAQVERREGSVVVSVSTREERESRAVWGLTRALIANALEGVSKGYERRLVVVGIGYRAELKGKNLELQVGYSHPVSVTPEPGVTFTIEDAGPGIEAAQATVVVRGVDKEAVGRAAAEIRKIRPPEPYKGKGIRYAGEHIHRKAGKAAAG